MKKYAYGIVAMACCLALALAGCSGGDDSQAQSTAQGGAETTAAEAAKDQEGTNAATTDASVKEANKKADEQGNAKTIGTKSSSSVEITLTNGSGKDIDEVSLREAGNGEYGENLLGEGTTIAAGEELSLYVEPSENGYDMRISTSDTDDSAEILGVPVSDVKSMELKESNGTYYVDYFKADGSKASTKADEAQPSDNSAGNNNGAGQENPSYVEESGDTHYEPEPVYEAPAYEEPVYEAPTYEAEPVAETSAPEQSSDACQGDVVLRD